jgi:serine/threonine protein kinase
MEIFLLVLLGLGILMAVVTLAIILLLSRRRRKPTRSPSAGRCPHCGRVVPDGVLLCPQCGKSLQTPQAPPRVEETIPPATGGNAYPRLVALDGPLLGQDFAVHPPPRGLTIGRESSNDVALTSDPLVSRQHAQVMPEGGAYVLHDRNSVNGVLVNGQRVMRHTLSDGDLIQICNSTFRFEMGPQAPQEVEKPSPPPEKEDASLDSMRLSGQTEFEGYRLEKKVGQGGMSVVYKAYDAQDKPVAIKVLDVTDAYVVRKFIQEGEIGVTLRGHPNICTVLSSGRARDDRLYLVMEFIEGTSLRSTIGRDLTETQIVDIVGQVCDALHYAHLRHIVHRDIKPENILIDQEGRVKVADFGIAKLTSSVTVTKNRLMGTPEYISPEQAQAQRILPTSDVYSVGVVLYELLTGRPPFPLPTYDSLTQERAAFNRVLFDHIHAEPTPPSQLRPDVPKRLERVTMRALEKEPRRRFSTAWEMAQAMGFRRKIAAPPAPPKLQASLVVVRGSQSGKRIPLSAKPMVLGRQQIAPDDAYLSHQHMSIAPRGANFWLEDMSRNGTWVNGERVYGETLLKSGDEIAVGEQVLRVEIH